MSYTILCKNWSRQPRDLKRGGLIANSSDSQNMQISNPNNMKWRHNDVIIVFSNSSLKQPATLKLPRLKAYIKFHKIWKFEDHVTRNDVRMMSLPKTTGKRGPPRNQSNYIHSKGIIQKCKCYRIWTIFSKVMSI